MSNSPSNSAFHEYNHKDDPDIPFLVDNETTQKMLLAGILDTVNILAWQNTADGEKGRNQPEPIPRPGTRSENDYEAMSVDEMFEWLDWDLPDKIEDLPN